MFFHCLLLKFYTSILERQKNFGGSKNNMPLETLDQTWERLIDNRICFNYVRVLENLDCDRPANESQRLNFVKFIKSVLPKETEDELVGQGLETASSMCLWILWGNLQKIAFQCKYTFLAMKHLIGTDQMWGVLSHEELTKEDPFNVDQFLEAIEEAEKENPPPSNEPMVGQWTENVVEPIVLPTTYVQLNPDVSDSTESENEKEDDYILEEYGHDHGYGLAYW